LRDLELWLGIGRADDLINVGKQSMLIDERKNFVILHLKYIVLLKSKLVSIIRGLYETDKNTPGYYLVGSIYGPSYLSFEFALGYHSLIPKAGRQFT